MRTVTLSVPVTASMIVTAFYTPIAVKDVDGNWWWLAGVNADGSVHLEAADI